MLIAVESVLRGKCGESAKARLGVSTLAPSLVEAISVVQHTVRPITLSVKVLNRCNRSTGNLIYTKRLT